MANMAWASQIQDHLIGDKGPITSHLSAKDREILSRPYAKAALEFENRPDLILSAIARLQTEDRQEKLNAERISKEVQQMLGREKNGTHCNESHPREDTGPGASHLSAKDREILSRPYAKAVLEIENRPDLVLCAVERLQSKDKQETLKAANILKEVQQLLEQEKNGIRCTETRSHSSSSDCVKTDDSKRRGDLEMDCAEPELPTKAVQIGAQEAFYRTPEAKTLEGKEALNNGDGVTAQKRKLHELLKENKRLRRRQKCLKCRGKPVSITFLPCGHCSYCYECGQSFDICPICLKTILADVKTYFG